MLYLNGNGLFHYITNTSIHEENDQHIWLFKKIKETSGHQIIRKQCDINIIVYTLSSVITHVNTYDKTSCLLDLT